MTNINLIPKDVIQQLKFQKVLNIFTFCYFVIFLFLSVLYATKFYKLSSLKLTLSKLDIELKKLEYVIKEVKQLETIKSNLETKMELLRNLIFNGLAHPKLMENILEVLPDDVWVSEFKTQALPDKERKIKEIKVNLVCFCYDKFSIADLLLNMEKSGKFKEINLGTIEISQQDQYELHKFPLEFIYIVE